MTVPLGIFFLVGVQKISGVPGLGFAGEETMYAGLPVVEACSTTFTEQLYRPHPALSLNDLELMLMARHFDRDDLIAVFVFDPDIAVGVVQTESHHLIQVMIGIVGQVVIPIVSRVTLISKWSALNELQADIVVVIICVRRKSLFRTDVRLMVKTDHIPSSTHEVLSNRSPYLKFQGVPTT